MGLNVKQTTTFLDSLTAPLFSIMFKANHAVGKSEVIRQFMVARKLFSIDLRLGQRDLGDILGMPAIVDGTDVNSKMTDVQRLLSKRFLHILPELLRPAFVNDLSELGVMGDERDVLKNPITGKSLRPDEDLGKPYEGICLFFDELNRGTKDVLQSCFQIVLDREMNGRKLHPRTWVFTAINGDLDTYTVTEIDPALISRFVVIEFEPTVDEWLTWGKRTGGLHESVIFCIGKNREIADPPKNTDGNAMLTGAHPNRRSWTMFSAWLKEAGTKLPLNMQKMSCACFVGDGAAEIWRTTTEEMEVMKQKRMETDGAETEKVEAFVKSFFRFNEMEEQEAINQLSTYSPSDMTALTNAVGKYFANFKYVSANARRSVKAFERIVKDEWFAKVWAGMNPDLKARFTAESPDIFGKYGK